MLTLENLDWQSVATLITGGAAVVGATWVGLRQAGITNRQAQIAQAQNMILLRQAEIEAQKLKADLFERRFKTYDACRLYLLHQGRVNDPERRAFLDKITESHFLFGAKVYGALQQIYEHGESYRLLCTEAEKEHQEGRNLDPAKSAKADQLIGWMLARTINLWTVFAADLRLDLVNREPTSAANQGSSRQL